MKIKRRKYTSNLTTVNADNITTSDGGVQVNDDGDNYAGTDNFSVDVDTTYYSKGIHLGCDVDYNISFPAKSGTLALTSDLLTNNKLLNLIYPVGSIYMSVNNVSPASFLGGTWEALKDRFLVGAGNSYSVNSTGGSTTSSYTLTSSNIPAHSHAYSVSGSTSAKTVYVPSQTVTGNVASSSNSPLKVIGSYIDGEIGVKQRANGTLITKTNSATWQGALELTYTTSVSSYYIPVYISGHNHSYSITIPKSSGISVGGQSFSANGSTGVFGQISPTAISVSTMSPYLAVYMWKRTA